MKRLIALFALMAPLPAAAQSWPDKPVHIVVAFTPGSATDVIGRSVANELSAKLGQTVIVENKPGAGGTIAASQVARGDADGYTVLVHSSGHARSEERRVGKECW